MVESRHFCIAVAVRDKVRGGGGVGAAAHSFVAYFALSFDHWPRVTFVTEHRSYSCIFPINYIETFFLS